MKNCIEFCVYKVVIALVRCLLTRKLETRGSEAVISNSQVVLEIRLSYKGCLIVYLYFGLSNKTMGGLTEIEALITT